MKPRRLAFAAPIILTAVVLILIPSCAKKTLLPAGILHPPETLAALQPLFADPPADYRSAPLWVWNDRVTKAEIDEQLADFKAKGIGGAFVHPRPGLITPYLSPEWLDLFKYAVDAGRRLGLKIWIYDENSYPSGFAGGHVPAAIPDAVRSGLRLTKRTGLPETFPVQPVVVLRKTENGFIDVTPGPKSGNPGPGEYYIFDINKQQPNPWYGGFTYVDIMRPDVTAKFLEVTLEAYKKAFGADFGTVVPGSFEDEAEVSPAGGQGLAVVNWTPRLFTAFRSKWGYDLRVHLPSLFEETGDWMRVRHDFYSLILDLFVEGWAKPYSDYCARNNLIFTGHYWEHEWPRPAVDPDNMALESWSHMPGIDILMNDYQTDTHAQFGNARSVKELRSVANQAGLPRTMSETYGAGGWDLRFFDQKRIADWEYALGVNFVVQHLSYVTVMGARKRDHPQSFSYHEPWWSDYRTMGDYLGRLSVATSSGRQDNRILVLEPTTTAWMYYAPGADSDKIKSIGESFQGFVNDLEAAEFEYDLGSEAILRQRARVDGRALIVGPQRYEAVVLPPAIESLDASTFALLKKFVGQGGQVLDWGEAPRFIDGRPDARPSELAAAGAGRWITMGGDDWKTKLARACPPALEFKLHGHAADGGPHLLFHHRRTLQDGELVFLANID
ncbi:MAG: glycosyl hydrolase, partial [Candidatus Aminicenantales bacterium]